MRFPESWGSYYKFCFVRNPYERAVSDYIFRVTSRSINVTFVEFLRRIHDPIRPDPEGVVPANPLNWPMYTINDEVAVDYIGRYEDIHEGMEKICAHVGLPYAPDLLPVAKKKKDYSYEDYYGAEEERLVSSIYSKEIDAFDY